MPAQPLCGGAVLGLIGALLAIPIAATIQAVASELLEERAERITACRGSSCPTSDGFRGESHLLRVRTASGKPARFVVVQRPATKGQTRMPGTETLISSRPGPWAGRVRRRR